MKNEKLKLLEFKMETITKFNDLKIKGGALTTNQSTVAPDVPKLTYGDCIPHGPVSSRPC